MELIDALLQSDKAAAEAPLRAWGLRDWAAGYDNLRRMAEGALPSAVGALVEELSRLAPENADPDRALNNLERYAQVATGPLHPTSLAVDRPFLLALVFGLGGFSQFMSDVLIRHPFYVGWLGEEGVLDQGLGRDEIRSSLADAMAPFSTAEVRRRAAVRWLRQGLTRLGAQAMLGRIDEETLTRCLSEQAAALADAAVTEARAELRPRFGEPIEENESASDPFGGRRPEAGATTAAGKGRRAEFCVVAMGKFGAFELNFSSDIDLMFLYSAEGRTTGSQAPGAAPGQGVISNHDYFCRLSERVINFLGGTTNEGYLYRVDTRLRPEGDDGPLARSLAAFEIYHETQARTWERMALLKARAVAGDPAICREFDSMSRALVFDRALDRDIARQVRELKDMIDGIIHAGGRGDREVKRGEGGIREIEFLVQTYQLIEGGRHASIRARSTLEAIDALAGIGRFSPEDADGMKRDYRFLRVIEHRLQMMDLRQTHTIPAEPEEVEKLARRCGLRSAEELMTRWGETRARVNRRFVEFFGPSGKPGNGPAPEDNLTLAARAARALMIGATEKEFAPTLVPFGLETPDAMGSLRRLSGQGRSLYLAGRGRDLFAELAPDLIELAGRTARPPVALGRLESYLQASGSLTSMYEIFQSNRQLLRLLLDAFGRAGMCAAALTAHPEYTDYLLDPAYLAATPSARELGRRIDGWCRIAAAGREAEEDPRAAHAAGLARVRRFESLMCAMAEIAGLIDMAGAQARLTTVADALLDAALRRRLNEAAGSPEGAVEPMRGVVALAMGKLGAREMNYYSDLDLIFAWDDAAAGGGVGRGIVDPLATELAQGTLDTLTRATSEGYVYNVDARLRPEGSNAPLCPPFSRYCDYYVERADLWELQSWMKIRPVAGDLEAGRELIARVAEVIRGRLSRVDWRADVVLAFRRMRRRIEDAAKAPSWVMCDFKKGYGGVIDLEFLAQFYQLRALAAGRSLIGLRSDEVFAAAAESGELDPTDAARLADDYRAMRLLESRSRLLFETEKSHVPSGGEKLEALAKVMSDLAPAQPEPFRDWLMSILRGNRSRFDRLLPG